MQARHYAVASPPNHYTNLDMNYSQASDNYLDCTSSANLASAVSSQSTQASATSALVWSAASSQDSDFTAPSTVFDSEYYAESQEASQLEIVVAGKPPLETHRDALGLQQTQFQYTRPSALPAEFRKNPRRTSAAASASRGCPPKLLRQADRKVEFVDKLVDSATFIVEAIWPTSLAPCRSGFGTSTSVLPLRKFIEETLRRSRTSYSTLQVGLYYLILIKPHIPAQDFTMEQTDESYGSRALQCGRRMFLAALILASKWLQDRNYSARAWSKISGLKVSEINENEIAFLAALNWKLHVTEELYNIWSDCVMKHTPSLPPTPPGGVAGRNRVHEAHCAAFKELIQGLTPGLENLKDLVARRKQQLHPLSLGSLLGRPVEEPYTPSPSSRAMMDGPPSPLPTLPALGLLRMSLATSRPVLCQTARGFSTPAVSAASQLLGGRTCSMSSVLSGSLANHNLERWQTVAPSLNRASPQGYVPIRRSSLANTVSTASSPESMVSDSSIQSRTSSVSSVSLTQNAPAYMQARRAGAERQRLVYGQQYQTAPSLLDEANTRRMSVANLVDSSPSDVPQVRIASPESYLPYCTEESKPAAKDTRCQLSDQDAAYALQELHKYRESDVLTPKAPQQWTARASQAPKRKLTPESDLQENVRGLLLSHPSRSTTTWSQPPYATVYEDDCDEYPGSKRSRQELYQPHLREAYGQHLLIPTA